jgi:tRNA threonylcarbamoyl adenosine modification protein YeaZ
MIVLAIDTALDFCAAAVLDVTFRTVIAQETLEMKRGHAEALMPLIARVMKSSGRSYLDLDRIAVTTGPGSFTGLRVGISAARGIGLAAGKPVIGITTLAAYAAPLVAEKRDEPILAAIDARHDHVYFHVVAGNGATLMKPAVAPIEDTFAAARFGRLRMVGNAAQILADRWPRAAPPPSLVAPKPGPDITWVAWIGAATEPGTAPAKPFYLRAPDAKPKPGFALPDAEQGA